MKVLLVNGYSSASNVKFVEFKHAVLLAVDMMKKEDVVAPIFVEHHRTDMREFVYEMHSRTADTESITRFDQLDFIFLDGDVTIYPWSPMLHDICLLVKMCMMTGKCLFGAGFAASILAYLCSTGGELLVPVNGNGNGSALKSTLNAPPPDDDINPHLVLLDNETGDYFNFNIRHNAWEPKGNTGIIIHTSDHDKSYGVRPTSARAGTRKPNNHKCSASVLRLGDLQCCGRMEKRGHPYLSGLEHSQFVVNCPSKFDLDEKISYTVYVDSQRGPILIEFSNTLCAHFNISRAYPATCTLMQNFVRKKMEQIRLHEHIDRAYATSITGTFQSDSMNTNGRNKTTSGLLKIYLTINYVVAVPASVRRGLDQSSKGRTSPKKCRPVFAAPSPAKSIKLRPRSAGGTTTHRHVYAQRLQSALYHNQEQHQSNNSPQNDNQIRICRLTDDTHKKPYCAYTKFEKLRIADGAKNGHGYYSVINDGPYRGEYEQQIIDDEKNKLKWIGGPFRTTFGKASQQEFIEDGILGSGEPYDVKKTVAYVLEPERNHSHPSSKTRIPKNKKVQKRIDMKLTPTKEPEIRATTAPTKFRAVRQQSLIKRLTEQLIKCPPSVKKAPVSRLPRTDTTLAIKLRPVVARNHSLTSLNMSKNKFDDNCAEAIGAMCNDNNHLLCLDLSWNSLRGKTGKCIGSSLEINQALQTLRLAWNGTGSANGATYLAMALRHNTVLQTLELMGNSIGAEGALALAHAWSDSSTLKILGLAQNPISTEGLCGIFRAYRDIEVDLENGKAFWHAFEYLRLLNLYPTDCSWREVIHITNSQFKTKLNFQRVIKQSTISESNTISISQLIALEDCDTPWRIPRYGKLNFEFNHKPAVPHVNEIVADAVCVFWQAFSNLEFDSERVKYMKLFLQNHYITAAEAQYLLNSVSALDPHSDVLQILMERVTDTETLFDLSITLDHRIAMQLIRLSADDKLQNKENGGINTSQRSYWECFRNETLCGKPYTISRAAGFPECGIFICDFIATTRIPVGSKAITPEELENLCKKLTSVGLPTTESILPSKPTRRFSRRDSQATVSVSSPIENQAMLTQQRFENRTLAIGETFSGASFGITCA
ncbi:hypothetical protein THRCLA_06945 [Thraustotheca clavata]|uniref:Uncharacterized protein n=1 Tax=Thraustotheca clavata TaxID=74557 RepID=A0A1V9ZHT3_9STRA|nr:hypothetical protein THRCLA_06945 [Thraustotheca clavata]